MAGDWLPMRHDLPHDPAVIGIASATGLDEDTVVGKLLRVWAWFDSQTTDGNARSVTVAWLDRYLGAPGFAQAMVDQNWLIVYDGGLQIPDFDKFISQSAKKRSLTAKRVASHKARRKREGNAGSVTTALPTEQNRREDIDNTPPTPQGVTGLERPPVADASQDEPPGEPLDPTGRTDWRQPNRPGPSTVPEMVPIPDALDTPEFRHAWSLWLASYREHHGRYPPQTSLQMTLVDLALAGVKDATERTLYTAKKGYKGIVDRVPPEAKQPARTPFMGLTEDDLRDFR